MKNLLVIFLTLIALFSCKAQLPPGEYTSTNKKAISLFESALKSYNSRDDKSAISDLTKAIEKDPNFIEPHFLLAQIYSEANQKQQAIDEYVKALEINPKFDKKTFYNLANLEASIGKYAEAKKDYETYLKYQNLNPDAKEHAERQLANCNFAIDAMKNPVPFDPKNMGEGINSQYDEYFPAVTADEQTFLYTRNNRTEKMDLQEDFLISKKANGVWQKSSLIGSGINTNGNEGAPCLSADGQILFFVACAEMDGGYGPNRKGYGSCDVFYAQKVGENWGKTYNLGPNINSKFFESQPSFSADGKTLYFVSNRLGGVGSTDIFYSSLGEDGGWSAPRNLGTKINTRGKEESVYIHPDGKTIYFGSDGHVGMGGLDLYVSRMNDKGDWSEPVNLGYPINTYGDENSVMVGATGDVAYFASNRVGGSGGLDLYKFDLYEAVRPGKITYVKGKVYDVRSKQPLGAHFELIDLATGKPVIESDANSGNGEFLVCLPVDKNYALNVSHPGYLFYSENFALTELADKSKPFLMDVPMQPIDTGSVIELKNVFFETAKYDLKPESKAELNKLVAFLNVNKTMKGELSGHTDNVGDKKMNMTLSLNRAKAVYDYLVANGIDAKRLTYKGFGDTRPKVKNDSDVNRAINRRTEFKVTGK
ncbi:MAG: OmpA family protein [Bacteroidota bacterium]|jgi:outer membrane protein OmpA-like peptidoglycan-associated protein/tetratricopeptide (TPR) repeat protein|nr:OmpA family protein [Bacteroidota bacterium]